MTTYYGVWSEKGNEWWTIGGGVFHTTVPGLAKAQAVFANAQWKRNMGRSKRRDEHWEVRAIGEDGLPKPVSASFEPFCLECKAWLELPKGVRMRDCPSCGKTLRVAYRGRKEAEEQSRPHLIVCKPCDLEACRDVVAATESESHHCAMCGKPATEYVDVHIKGHMCDRHKVVSVGGLEGETDPELDKFVGV